MFSLMIPLKHIILDPTKPLDLSTIPEHDAVELIKKSYGFLSPAIQVTIADGTATIQMEEARGERIGDALKQFQKAVREAQQGNYQKAVKLFCKVLEVIPQHVDARRNMAMAHLETGEHQQAKLLLEECLKIDPTDAWTFVLLGNIAAKHHRSAQAAALYYETGLAINPDDPLLLCNYATLLMQGGQRQQAQEFFEKAISVNPGFPNSYCGLALLHNSTGGREAAFDALERLFLQADTSDRRNGPMIEKARELYLDLSTDLARTNSGKLMERMQEYSAALGSTTGYPVVMEEDNTLVQISAAVKIAWKHGTNSHHVRYRMKDAAVTPHLVAHELEHVVLEHEARRKGRNRTFVSTEATELNAQRILHDHAAKLKKNGYPPEKAEALMNQMYHGINNQLFNCPLDMIVEQNLRNKHPELRNSQFVSLNQLHQEALKGFKNKEIKAIAPPIIYRASIALNCATALFVDMLYKGITNFSAPYRDSDIYPLGRNLFDIWKKRMENFTPGDEYEIVDEFARQLKLAGWFEWRGDAVQFRETDTTENVSTTPTQPLTTDKPEAYNYCLDALNRFDDQSRDHLFAIISEISLLGMNGIDHAEPKKNYSLKSYPGEAFSGLHLLCLMYVGFKLYDPKVDCGLDFAEAYKLAQESHKAMTH